MTLTGPGLDDVRRWQEQARLDPAVDTAPVDIDHLLSTFPRLEGILV